MDERMHFIVAHQRGDWGMAELCRAFGISRKTGYKWLRRYETDGVAGLVEHSRAPHHQPHAVHPDIAALLLQARQAHPTWGPRKLMAWLHAKHPALPLPAASTVGALLKRAGVIVPRRHRRACPSGLPPVADGPAPNAVWCADFKGQFRTGDGQLCYPLTISDHASRYLLRCQALPRPDEVHVWPLFEATFREYGLPDVLRTDNGAPFASVGLGGLTKLSVWWIKLGIQPARIAPGKPQQNGRHERLHRTLKQDALRPPAATLRAQQRAFDRFQAVYNHERPHEALGQQPPARVYQPSPRPYVPPLREMAYPTGYVVRRVRHNGELRWRGQLLYVSMALVGELVGLDQVDDARWEVYFGPLRLGVLDERHMTISHPPAATARQRRAHARPRDHVLPMSPV